MIICPGCDKEFSELDGVCHRCRGRKFITIKYKKGPKGHQTEHEKEAVCPRCNGAGTEQANFNRNNRKRGATGEYKAIDTFEGWWLKPDGTKYEWRKTPQSGGSALAAGFDMAGDICTTAPDWPFHVESKRTAGWDFGQLLNLVAEGQHIYGDMKKYVEQVFNDCPIEDGRIIRLPMLFLQHPGPSQPAYIMLVNKMGAFNPCEGLPGVFTGIFQLEKLNAQVGTPFFRYNIMHADTFVMRKPEEWRSMAELALR